MGGKYGPTFNGPIGDRNLLTGPSRGKVIGLEINNGSESIGMSSKGTINGQAKNSNVVDRGVNIAVSQDLHGKSADCKQRHNTRNRGYQAEAKINPAQNGAFNPEQLEQLYQIFSSLQTTGQPSPNGPSSSLAHKGNFLSTLCTTSKVKTSWIIDSGASDHKTDSYNLFSSCSTCAGNVKVKIVDDSLSSVAEKRSIKISNSMTLESILHVPNLSLLAS